MKEQLAAEAFLKLTETIPLVDVRTPAEFDQGHIPGAFNIPLFSNDERVVVGTLYKKSGKEAAMLKGLDIVGPQMSSYVKSVKRIAPKGKVLVHCWRGGMRSASMAWLFHTAGLEATTLIGGYKAYRGYIREQLGKEVNLVVLGGKTGSGKSEVLRVLAESGCQMLDLEAIAHHKGSAFGHIGQEEQPTTEQFENNLYEVWKSFDLRKTVWLEDESRSIGRVSIPEPLFNRMRVSPVIFIDLSIEERAKRLVKEYAEFEPESLESAVLRISKRLGGQNVKDALQAIKMKDFSKAASITLLYYDKAYLNGLEKRSSEFVFKLPLEEDNPEKNALLVKEFYAASFLNVEKK